MVIGNNAQPFVVSPVQMMGDSSEAEEKPNDPVRRSRRRRKSKRESSVEQSRPGGPSHVQAIYPLVQVKRQHVI